MNPPSKRFYDPAHGELPLRPTPQPELPWVSIITPNYNYGHFLEKCIRSVLGQTYPNIEYHIIDGGSTDASLEVIKRYENCGITSWTSEPDKGQTDAINKGFAKCTGDIFIWLNSDDAFSDPDVLNKVSKHFAQGVQFLAGQIHRYQIDAEGAVKFHKTEGSVPVTFEQYLYYWKFPCLPQPGVFVARDIAAQAFPLSPELRLIMDYQFFLRCLACQPRAQWVDTIFVDFYIHDSNLSCSAKSPSYKVWDEEFSKVFTVEAKRLASAERRHYLAALTRQQMLNRLMRGDSRFIPCLTAGVKHPKLIAIPLYWKTFIKAALGSSLYERLHKHTK